jgi:hypothetical protein
MINIKLTNGKEQGQWIWVILGFFGILGELGVYRYKRYMRSW